MGDSSEATSCRLELPASNDRDTPVSAEFARIPGRAVGAVFASLSDRFLPCSARRAGVHNFLAGLASPDAGNLSMSDMREEVFVGGRRA